MIDAYTHVLEAVAETQDKELAERAVAKLIAHLRSAGRLDMLSRIAHELRKIAERRKTLKPIVEVARAVDAAWALKAAAEAGIVAETATINPSLIRGWRAHGKGKLIDRSAKHALINIYQQVTH